MALEDTGLKTDVQWVTSASSASSFTYKAILHCGRVKDLEPLRVISFDTLEDYEEGFADEVMVDLMMVREDYEKYIFPNRDSLILTLIRNPIGTVSDALDTSRAPAAKQYRATLRDPHNQAMSMGSFGVSHSEKYTNLTIYPISLQLIDLAVEQLMLTTVGGIYRKMTPGNVLLSELTRISHSLTGLDDADRVKGVNMYPPPTPSNNKPIPVRNHVVVPHGTRLVDLADHIQKKEGGIYDTGISMYYQRNYWHVAPPYDVTRFAKTKRTLTVLSVRSVELPAADCTYRVDGDSVTIVANGKTIHLDTVDHEAVNQGNGVRFARAQNLFDGFTPGTTDGQADSQNVMAGFVSQSRDSKKNYVPFSKNRITDNTHYELSQLAKRQGQRIQINWDRADPSLITPLMPVRFLYEAGGTVFEMLGCVLNQQTQTRTDQPGMTSTRYVSGCALTLFVAVARTMKA